MIVFLVEDDPETGSTVQAMLEALGHQVTWAVNGRKALAEVEGRMDVEVLLTDILMPEMDGLEAIQGFRKRGFGGRIVAMTAQHDMPYLQAARLLGADGILRKPFELADLARAVDPGWTEVEEGPL